MDIELELIKHLLSTSFSSFKLLTSYLSALRLNLSLVLSFMLFTLVFIIHFKGRGKEEPITSFRTTWTFHDECGKYPSSNKKKRERGSPLLYSLFLYYMTLSKLCSFLSLSSLFFK